MLLVGGGDGITGGGGVFGGRVATGDNDVVEDGIGEAVGIGVILHLAPPLATERGSSKRIYSNVWFPMDSPPATKMCFNLGTTLIE